MIFKLLLLAILLLPHEVVQGGENFCSRDGCKVAPIPIKNPNPDSSNHCEASCNDWVNHITKYLCTGQKYLKESSPPKCMLCLCPKPGIGNDPLFIGLSGQIFKFDGRNDAWYAHVATETLQWNIQFGQFSTCPKDGDSSSMFVTAATSMLFFPDEHFKKTKPSHYIVIKTVRKNEYYSTCDGESPCLANGSLFIEIDGHRVTEPGDHTFNSGYGRVIAHNNFRACSSKWYNYRENMYDGDNLEDHARKLYLRRPIDYLIDNHENMLDSNECSEWLVRRIQYDDLFDQQGDWATIHIDTPLVSFHVEYKKNYDYDNECMSHSIDAWITRTASELDEEKWEGILGETAKPKFDSEGHEILFDRAKLLSAKDDESYEVDGEFGTAFKAQHKFLW